MKNYINNFITHRPATIDIAGAITQQDSLNLQHNNYMLNLQKEKREADKEYREWQDQFRKDNQLNEYINLNETNINLFYAKALDGARGVISELGDKYYKGTLTPQERIKFENAVNTPKRLKSLLEPFKKTINDINDGVVHKNDELTDYFKNLGSGSDVTFDEQGILQINITDKDGNKKSYKYDDMLKGIEGFGLMKNIDFFKVLEAVKVEPTSITTNNPDDFTKSVTKEITDEQAESIVDAIIFKDPNSLALSDASKSYFYKLGKDVKNITQEDLNALKEEGKKYIKAIKGGEFENTTDLDAMLRKKTLEQQNEHFEKEYGLSVKEFKHRVSESRRSGGSGGSGGSSKENNALAGIINSDALGVSNALPKAIGLQKPYNLGNVKTKVGRLTNVNVKAIGVTKNGDIIARVNAIRNEQVKSGGKLDDSKTETELSLKLSIGEADMISQHIGFNNSSEMISALGYDEFN